MTVIDFNAFGGMEGQVKQKRLMDYRSAVYAKNTRLWDGSLRAYKKPKHVGDCACSNFSVNASGVASCLPDCAVMARSPCGARARYTLIDGRIAESGRKVGINRPTQEPTAQALGEPGINSDSMLFRVICVNEHGESSAPSAPTNRVSASYGQTVMLKWDGCRPYRVEALLTQSISPSKELGASTSQWVSVGEFDSATALLPYEPDSWNLTSDGYDPALYCDPPELDCFLVTDDGFFVGWKGSTLFTSERHEPSKFLRSNIKNLHANIIEAVSARNAVYVSTDEGMFVIRIEQGKEDAIVAISKTYENHVAIKGTLGLLNSGVIYSTQYGIALLDEAGRQPQIISSGLIHEDQWESNWLPKKGIAQRGIYYGTTEKESWHIDFPGTSGNAADFGKVVLLDSLGGYQFAGKDGVLYYSDPGGVWAFDRGNGYLRAEWESGEIPLPSITAFSRFKVHGENLDGVVLTVIIDGEEVFTTTVEDGKICTLPLCATGTRVAIKLVLPTSSKEISVNSVQLATSVSELARVP
jgi:hypothetical protein